MRIAILPLPYPSAVTWFRATGPAAYLSERGHEVVYLLGEKATIRGSEQRGLPREAQRELVRTADVVHVLGPGGRYESAPDEFRERRGVLSVDLDDDVWAWVDDEAARAKGLPGSPITRERARDLETWLRAADVVTTTTPKLAEVVGYRVPGARVAVCPNALGPEAQRSRPRKPEQAAVRVLPKQDQPRNDACECGSGRKWKKCHGQAVEFRHGARVIGWTGHLAHVADLTPVLEALTRVSSVDADVHVRSLGPVDFMGSPGFRKGFKGVYSPVVFPAPPGPKGEKRVSLVCDFEHYYDAIEGMSPDVAVLPLRDSPFNRGKSAVTLHGWGIQGVPVVCSSEGPYAVERDKGFPAVYVEHGNVDAWVKALRDLLYDPVAAAALGQRAHAWVMERHAFPKGADAWETTWAAALAARKAAVA